MQIVQEDLGLIFAQGLCQGIVVLLLQLAYNALEALQVATDQVLVAGAEGPSCNELRDSAYCVGRVQGFQLLLGTCLKIVHQIQQQINRRSKYQRGKTNKKSICYSSLQVTIICIDFRLINFITFICQQKAMMQRVREFGDLRASRSSKKDNLNNSLSSKAFMTPKSQKSEMGKSSVTSLNSHYVCINCINTDLSAEKRREKHQKETADRNSFMELEKSRRQYEHELAESRERKEAEDKRKITDYNRALIESKEKQRINEQRAKEAARRRQEQQAIANQKVAEEEQARRLHEKQQFRSELQNQIREKNERKLRQQMKEHYPEPLPQDQGWNDSAKKEKYRQELQDQMRDNRERRQRELLNNSVYRKQQEALINELMDSSSKKYQEHQKTIKKQLRQEENAYHKSQEDKKREIYEKRQKEMMEALINQQFQQKQQQQNEMLRNERAIRYKRQIQQQIKENQQKRHQMKNANKTHYNSTIGIRSEQIQRKLCDSCEKTYPKKYMTKVKKR